MSDSNLLLFSLPVALWDMLPKDPAISFVSFVRSRNLLTPRTMPIEQVNTKSSRPEALKTSNADVALDDGLLDLAQRPSLWDRFKNDLHWSVLPKVSKSFLRLFLSSIELSGCSSI